MVGGLSGELGAFLRRLVDLEQRAPDDWWARCPCHNDKGEPNLHVTLAGDRLLLHCFRCGATAAQILSAVGMEWSALFEGSYESRPYQPARIAVPGQTPTVEAMASRLAVEPAFLTKLGWCDTGRGVRIPYCNPDGTEAFAKIRTSLDGKPKYQYENRGTKSLPYGLERVGGYRGGVILVEGETDCAALWAAGAPALGIPGATNLGCLDRNHLLGVSKAFVVREADEAGLKFATDGMKLLDSWGLPAKLVELPAGVKDPAALRARDPRRFKSVFRDCVQNATVEKPRDPLVRLSEIETREIAWVWPPRIPRGAVTMLAGHGGTGKSCLVAYLSAGITTGQWTGKPGTVLLFAAEDDLDSVVKPRVERSGGDLSKVFCYSAEEAGFGLRTDLATLESFLDRTKADLLVFDPIIAYHEGDTNKANIVRQNLGPLARIARERRIAVLLVAHMAKGDRQAEQLIAGSMDFWSVARSVLLAFRDPAASDGESRGVLAHAKSSTSYEAASLRYVIREGVVEMLVEESPLSARDLAQPPPPRQDREAVRDCTGWLRELLSRGPLARERVLELGKAKRFPLAVIMQAKLRAQVRVLNVQTGRVVFGEEEVDVAQRWTLDDGIPGELKAPY